MIILTLEVPHLYYSLPNIILSDMTQQDKLFVFIQSLTRAEKSYFTKYARLNATKEKPDYLLLFDYLSEARKYDEATLKKYFKGEVVYQATGA